MKPSDLAAKTAYFLSWLAAIIIAILPFHAVFATWLSTGIGHLNIVHAWKEIIILAMVPPVIWLAWRRPAIRRAFLKSWIFWLAIAYAALCFMLGGWALADHKVGAAALAYGLLIDLRFLAFFLICMVLALNHNFLERNWRKILLVPAGVVVIFGLLQRFILPSDFMRHFGYGTNSIPAYQTVDANVDYRRIQSSLRGANPLGAYLVLIIPAIVVSWWGRRWLELVSVIAAGTVLFFSYSRSAWVGLAISLIILFWLSTKRLSGRWTLAAVITLSVAAFTVYSFRSSQITQDIILHTSSSSTSAVSSNDVRSQAMKNGLNDVIHQPLGRGPGTAGPASFRNIKPARIAENYYLQLGQEIGILGMALFLAINLLVARGLWLNKADTLSKILLASLVGITFVNLVSHAWADDTLSLVWWGLAGVALSKYVAGKRVKVPA